MPRRRNRALDQRRVHERDRPGVRNHERNQRSGGVGAASPFRDGLDRFSAAGVEWPVDHHLIGTFDEGHKGLCIARDYAQRLSTVLGVPALPLFDLSRLDQPERFLQ
jgi:hypothetical protein